MSFLLDALNNRFQVTINKNPLHILLISIRRGLFYLYLLNFYTLPIGLAN